MEDDSAGNTDSMEKSAHFSISAALSQWLDVCGLPEIVSKMQRFASITKWSEDIVGECLNEVSEVMMCCEDAVSVEFIHFFGPIMLELLQRASRVQLDSQLNHQQMCVLLGRLIMDNKSTSKFVMHYFQSHPPPFNAEGSIEPPKKRSKFSGGDYPSELSLVVSCYRLLFGLPDYFANMWPWSAFIKKFSGHSDPEIRWIAGQCLSQISGMSEADRLQFISQNLTEEEDRKFSLKYFTPQPSQDFKCIKNCENSGQVSKGTLSEGIVDIEGVLLPVHSQMPTEFEPLVPVTSTQRHLQSIALALTSDVPLLVTGPVGCGKTCLIEFVAALTGRTVQNQGLLKVQLGDQTDAKVLLGTYHSTDVPGEFVWTAGVLTKAVREGRWLLLEDIDYAPMDVVSMLLPVIESRTLTVPGHGDLIRAAPGFQLLATQRVNSHEGATVNAASMLKKMWRRLVIEPLSRTELQTVIEVRYPTLSSMADKLLDVYYLLNGQNETVNVFKSIDRPISPRDLFKWCHRMAAEFRLEATSLTCITTQLHFFQDAMDCFTACVLSSERRLLLSEDIGGRLNLLKAKAEFYNNSYKPTLETADESVTIGRARLNRARKNQTAVRATFSWTRNSAVLLERLAVSVRQAEPVLLVGETGTGKTSTVQYLAQLLGHKLLVINMNQQSDSADLLGGYKPVDLKYKVGPIRQEFETLFRQTFDEAQNMKFLMHVATCFANRRWNDLMKLMNHSQQSALAKCSAKLRPQWEALGFQLQQLRTQIRHADTALAFSFVEGSLVQALKRGDWVLLDEINLASAETLECLSGLLESQRGSVFLLERGDHKPVERHAQFRLFAAMNPATDVGKKQLPSGLRSRFTEFFVDEISSAQDLTTLAGDYLRDLNLTSSQLDGIVDFYLNIRGEALRSLCDGTGRQPHYSLRTLCRALMVSALNLCGTVARSLYEGFCLSFLTQLDRSSHPLVENLVVKHIIGKRNTGSVLRQALPQPRPFWAGQSAFIQVEGYWVPQGDLEPSEPASYIVTDSVKRNLKDLVRVVALGRLPVLLQGETSVGKTSLIGYLAQLTGNKCVRVNNHEHTDLQEYVGSYTADESGKLVFREGVLVDAMRRGYWLILDELNLAPSEVLEALNRLLDDNRELFIAETQETVRAHPRFLLFATQNPPGGQYGGRKLLSRAFRNRFVELHFDEIPADELETILHRRCAMPPSYCKRLVAVLKELQLRRRGSAAFAGKAGFMTLRDLFRWAERYRLATNTSATFYDWDRHLADEGYLVLAGRVRKDEDALVIRQVLEKHFKTVVDPERLFTLDENTSPVTRPILERLATSSIAGFDHLVWTLALRRLAVLVGQALRFVEPILLVGDTGCGKTTICQYLAAQRSCQLMTVNCHQYSEGSDFLGGLRPVRSHERTEDGGTGNAGEPKTKDESAIDRLFEWVDGPLVLSMKGGHMFLADEISLADDSVLERLNSVLEPERSLLLSEKAGGSEPEIVSAADGFRFVSTMNPGGDYGKKELSPALRNRLTEIWCPLSRDKQDIIDIVEHNLRQSSIEGKVSIAGSMVEFIDWFSASEVGRRSTISIRDVLSWVFFINSATTNNRVDLAQAYVHGGCLVFLDSLGNRAAIETAIHQLCKPLTSTTGLNFSAASVSFLAGSKPTGLAIVSDARVFGVEPFFIEKGPVPTPDETLFTFEAPSTAVNLIRLLRALQLKKPLLLEGSPGVGKTSLVSALAEAAGHQLVRINLSEQTDVSDLFGADLPVEGSETGGHFQWRDGPLLRALKLGHWIVLDELNLASQSVLEGLNAVLDHRGELYIPELGRSFRVRPEMTKLFACQNPLKQGGARKGLPQSFLNRFTQVYVEPLSRQDLEFIGRSVFKNIDPDVVGAMVAFNERLVDEVLRSAVWGHRGGPWEFNLRDLFRWCHAVERSLDRGTDPGRYVGLLYADRMRTLADRQRLLLTYEQVFGPSYPLPLSDRYVYVTETSIQVGSAVLARRRHDPLAARSTAGGDTGDLLLLQRNLQPLESLMHCIRFNWMAILVGRKSSGKTNLIRLAAQLTGHPLDILTTNSAMDTTELLGGFEQGDLSRSLEQVALQVDRLCQWRVRHELMGGNAVGAVTLLELWEEFRRTCTDESARTVTQEMDLLMRRAQLLLRLLALMRGTGNAEVAELEEKLRRLVEQASRSANGGGRFEWVDSLLVKALREGHWLLIDNVNLCSASVLDRLNGLLEPNGVLTLSERGVIDGEIPTVRPHPQFRLFLAMDPRHGEISRAMRNRGVEIYLFDPDEVEYPAGDVGAILRAAGLESPLPQRTLLTFHESLCRALTSVDKPTLTELLQAASLTAQRSRTFASRPLTCLEDACSDVYIRNMGLASDRDAARQLLADALQAALLAEKDEQVEEEAAAAAAAAVMSTRDIQLSSTLARVRQAVCLVEHQMRIKGHGLADSILLLYLTSSARDADWRNDLLERVLARTDGGGVDGAVGVLQRRLHRTLNEQLRGQMSRRDPKPSRSALALPWDPRWFRPVGRHHGGLDGSDEAVNNRSSLALFWNAWNAVAGFASCAATGATVATFYRAFKSGSLAEQAVPHRLFIALPDFLADVDDAVERLLNSADVYLSDEDWSAVLEALRWRLFMDDLHSLPAGGRDNEATVNRMTQYWTWLTKCSLPALERLLERFGIASLAGGVEQVRSTLSSTLASRGGSSVLARRLRRVVDDPPAEPFATEDQACLARVIRSIFTASSASVVGGQRAAPLMQQLSQSLAESAASRNSLDVESLSRRLSSLADQLGSASSSSAADDDYMASLLDHLLMVQHFSAAATGVVESSTLADALGRVPSLCAALLRPWYASGKKMEAPWAECHLSHWEAVVNLSLSRRSAVASGEEAPSERLTSSAPLISLSVANVVQGAVLPLGETAEKKTRLQLLKEILWNNATQIQRGAFDPLANDGLLASRCLHELVRAVSAAVRLTPAAAPAAADGPGDQLEFVLDGWKSLGVPLLVVDVIGQAWQLSAAPPTVENVGALWLLLGLARCTLLAPSDGVDPVEKRVLKANLRNRQLEQLERFLEAHRLQQTLLLGACWSMDETQHPHARQLQRRRDLLERRRREDEARRPSWRPPHSPLYLPLTRDVHHLMSSVASPPAVLELLRKLRRSDAEGDDDDSRLLVSQAELFVGSQRTFYQSLKEKYVDYPDLTVPLLAGIGQMIHGVELLTAGVEKRAQLRALRLTSLDAGLDDAVSDLFDRPSRLVAGVESGALKLAHLCTDVQVGRLFDAVFDASVTERDQNKKVLLLSALKEVERHACHAQRLTDDAWTAQLTVLDALVAAWNASQDLQRRRAEEEESLYKSRTTVHQGELSDDEAERRALQLFFPTYESEYDQDEPSLEPVQSAEAPIGLDFQLSQADQEEVCRSHVRLLCLRARSMVVSSPTRLDVELNDSTRGGFFMRYPFLAPTTAALRPSLTTQLDRRLAAAHICFVHHALLPPAEAPAAAAAGRFDFYYDACPEEAVHCRPVLEHLGARIDQLLDQWPGHATLLDIKKLNERILGFDVRSPLMKLVTGLELLLTKCQEWEMNAHRGVSVGEDIQSLSQLVLKWRTMELDSWKACLTSVERRASSSAAKYWFHLYSTFSSLLKDKEEPEEADNAVSVQKTLRHFMESSTIGQYEARLRMLWAFAGHVEIESKSHQPRRTRHLELLRVLMSTLLFYGQFEATVAKRKATLRQPIDKKVRDFVKIMRWNDINYYALKEAVNKAHQTLHKHMKEWQTLLEQPVKSLLSEPDMDQETEQQQQGANQQPLFAPSHSFVSRLQVDETPVGPSPTSASYPVLSRLPTLCSKSHKLSGQFLAKSPFEQRIGEVDDLVAIIASTSADLQKLQVIGGSEKEKQKREAKAISMRKRKSLSELFRVLQQLGLSYGRGLSTWKETLPALDHVLPVLEVGASLEHLPRRPTTAALERVWRKCPLYYARCVARLVATARLLEKPSAELGPANVQRCKGFAAHFMDVVQQQWRQCSRTHFLLVRLRLSLAQLCGAFDDGGLPVAHATFVDSLDRLFALVVDALTAVDEFEQLMRACPDSNQKDVFQLQGADIHVVSRSDAADLVAGCVDVRSQLNQLRRDMDQHFHLFWKASPTTWLFDSAQWSCVRDGYRVVAKLKTRLDEMAVRGDRLGFGASLHQLSLRFARAVESFEALPRRCQPDDVDVAVETRRVDRLCQSMLHAIQQVYNKYVATPAQQEDQQEAEDESDEFEKNHLTHKVMKELVDDVSQLLKLEASVEELSELVAELSRRGGDPRLLASCAPVIDQYTCLVEYYFGLQLGMMRTSSKLQSVLLNVFNQLLEKGFCQPSELDESPSGGSGSKFEEIESGGLGDGQGATDVSDQIENEDQLEGAQQRGQDADEKEQNDDADAAEEENGIEMSTDFDAELQDREKKEAGEESDDDDDDQDDDQDQLDKEMAETGPDAEQLDEKLWGSDEEQDDDEDQDQDEGQGQGQKKESQLTAKNGDDDDDEDGSGDGAENKKKEPKPQPLDDDDADQVNDDQTDAQHGSHEPPPEPEPMDVPDDLNLDGGDPNRDDGPNETEEDPFDIDAVKEDQDEPVNETDAENDAENKSEQEDDTDAKDEEQQPGADSTDAPNPTGDTDDEDGDKDGDQEMEELADDAGENGEKPPQETPQAVPSLDQPSQAEAQPAADEAVKGSQDRTAQQQEEDAPPQDGQSNQEAENEDAEGVGAAESRQNRGHEGQQRHSKVNRQTPNVKDEHEELGKAKPKKPGQSDPDRALAEKRKERVLQVHSTVSTRKEEEEGQAPEQDDESPEAGHETLYEHVKKVDQRYDAVAKDVATEEQAKEQLTVKDEHQEAAASDDEKEEPTDDVVMKDDPPMDEPDVERVEAEPTSGHKQQKKHSKGDPNIIDQDESKMEVEGEVTATLTANRGAESSYVTQSELLVPSDHMVTMEEIEQLRGDIEQRLSTWNAAQVDDGEGQETWKQLEVVTSGLAQDLCEQLRLILEPSQASRLKGDYRTGKRLNMRKVIPYIASQFRKDRIWLRRTKPAQRNYQIVLAVDDSSSMADNRSRELAFESVALISKALCLLEAGQLGVLSFGEEVKLLHPLHDTFSDVSGPRILQQFTFEQKKTQIAKLVDFTTALMIQARSSSASQTLTSSTAQLLLIVSDGRGLFSEGTECVLQSIRRAKQSGLFMVFVVVDNPESKDSILDIRVPVFDAAGKLLGIKSYLDNFPFPFYVLLRDIQTLPAVLSDALRQWFELVTSATNL